MIGKLLCRLGWHYWRGIGLTVDPSAFGGYVGVYVCDRCGKRKTINSRIVS